MTWFRDLTPYTYLAGQAGGAPTLNIGWLERGHDFPTGDVPPQLVARLAVLRAHGATQQTRGRFPCDLCPPHDWDEDESWSSAEIRAVSADGTRYAAPSLVAHYVAAHRYAPPQAFVDAALRVSIPWERAVAEDLCMSCGGSMSRVRTIGGLVRMEGAIRMPGMAVRLACTGCGTHYSRMFPEDAPRAPDCDRR